jgi:hypothetical protein
MRLIYTTWPMIENNIGAGKNGQSNSGRLRR